MDKVETMVTPSFKLTFTVTLIQIFTNVPFIIWSLLQVKRFRTLSVLITPNEAKAPKIFKIQLLLNQFLACFDGLELLWTIFSSSSTGWNFIGSCLPFALRSVTWILLGRLIFLESNNKFTLELPKFHHHVILKSILSAMFMQEILIIVDTFLQRDLVLMSWTFGTLILRLVLIEGALLLGLYGPGLPELPDKKKAGDDVDDEGEEDEKKFVSKLPFWTKVKMLKPYVWPDEGHARVYIVICMITLAIDRFLTVGNNLYNKKVVDSMDFNLGLDAGTAASTNVTVSRLEREYLEDKLSSQTRQTMGFRMEFRWDFVALSVLLNTLKYGTSLIRSVLQLKIKNVTTRGLQVRLFDKLHSLSLSWHLERRTGAIIYKLQQPLGVISWQLEYFLTEVLMAWSDMIVSLIYIASAYNEQITVLLIITMICSIALDLIFHNWDRQYEYWSKQLESKKLDKAIDSIMTFETVKYFSNEMYETKRFTEACQEQESAERKQWYVTELLYLIRYLMEDFGLLGAKLVCLWMVFKNRGISPGDYVFLSTTLQQFTNPISRILNSYSSFMTDLDELEELHTVLDLEPDVCDNPDSPALIIHNGQIEVKNVSFHYKEDKPILKDISFKVEGGKTLAIVGPSGGGKSTIIKLLFRFYDTIAGEILIDGQNIQRVKQHSLRKAIGVVPQDTILFNDTIANNILYGKIEDGTIDDVIRAAKLACIHDKIETFTDKYQTKVAERGLKLSGGEKQRVGIARMLLKDPKIVLLDEATSSLDTKTERSIQQSLKNACENRTSIIIAHRLSTIVQADQIIVLKDGAIAESGTHNELMKLKGTYADMWQDQVEHEAKNVDEDPNN